jgi:processive 1,2-diacylglycerol beta-glucosyltransferase
VKGPGRILVLSASAGAGHLRAAEAVEAACRQLYPEAEVSHVDVLTLTPAPFRRAYGKGYLDFVNRAPELMGILYDRTNRPPRRGTADAVRKALDRLNTRPLVEHVRAFAPDVICHTHFLPAEILARERRKRRTAPNAVVVTDFEVHRFWLCPGVERYFVAREENAEHLEALGEPRGKIEVTGIPIHPVFARKTDPKALRAKHGIVPGRALVLVLCGGFGVGPVEEVVTRLVAALPLAQVVVVAGRNEALQKRLQSVASSPLVKILGFTREMHEWMAIADLAVTKPGGLTVSEALAMGLPLVLANPIPGQETRNATMLYEEGAAISGENPLTIGPRVGRLLEAPPRLKAMRRAARRLGHPRAAATIAEELGRLALAPPDGTTRAERT